MRKYWYQSKTVWINALVIAGSAIELLQSWLVEGDFSAVGMTTLSLGLVNLALRVMTTDALIK